MMIRMQVPPNEARKLIRAIPHKTCQTGMQKNWVEGGRAGVTAQSICWLYCWAKTGMNSDYAALQARRAFNQIFDKPYEWFDARVDHDWARQARYQVEYIEDELDRRLGAD